MTILADQKTKILKELYKHYIDYQDFVSRTGQDVIEVWRTDSNGEPQAVWISFSDLKEGVSELAPRKKEAFLLHIIFDKKQREVADIMGITTVSVGQYVEAALAQLSKRYFAEEKVKAAELKKDDST